MYVGFCFLFLDLYIVNFSRAISLSVLLTYLLTRVSYDLILMKDMQIMIYSHNIRILKKLYVGMAKLSTRN